MADYGRKIDSSLTQVDNALAVNASTSNVNGSSSDLGANTSPQPDIIVAQFAITNSGSTDGYDLDVRAQFSFDNSNWCDAGLGQILGNFYSASAGADLTRSAFIVIPVLARYVRFQYDNNNGTDNLSVSSWIAKHIFQT